MTLRALLPALAALAASACVVPPNMEYPGNASYIEHRFAQTLATGGHTPGNVNTRFEADTSTTDYFPMGIFMASTVQDVVAVVQWAVCQKVGVRVRSGGHGYNDCSLSNSTGVTVDVSQLNSVTTDGTVAVIGPGARVGDINQELYPSGVTLPMSSSFDVGIGGLTVGGGTGILSRQYGLMADLLVSAEVVLATGEQVTVTPTTYPDLWVGMRGAGADFGIVVSFTFKVVPMSAVIFYKYPGVAFDPAVGLAWQSTMPAEPSDSWHAMHFRQDTEAPSPTAVMDVLGLYNVAGSRTVDSVTQRLTDVFGMAPPVVELWSDWNYTLAQLNYQPNNIPHAWTADSAVVNATGLFTEANFTNVAALVEAAPAITSPLFTANFEAAGGAISLVAANETAYPHRSAAFTLQLVAAEESGATPDQRAAVTSWLSQWSTALQPNRMGRYRNFPPPAEVATGDAVLQDFYGANLPVLKALKAKYDPGNMFTCGTGTLAA